jgi:hypothetical protein
MMDDLSFPAHAKLYITHTRFPDNEPTAEIGMSKSIVYMHYDATRWRAKILGDSK